MHEKELHIAGCYEGTCLETGEPTRLQLIEFRADGSVAVRDYEGLQDVQPRSEFAAWAQQRVISLHPLCDLDNTPVPPLKQEGL